MNRLVYILFWKDTLNKNVGVVEESKEDDKKKE
jgi:hypothetical protein